MTSVVTTLVTATETVIEGLGLTGFGTATIRSLKVEPTDRVLDAGTTFPVILCAPFGRERLSGGPGRNTNESRVVGYPVMVAIIDAANDQMSAAAYERDLEAREEILDHLDANRVAVTLPTGYTLLSHSVEPGPIVAPGAWFDRNAFFSGLTVVWWVRRLMRGG